MACLRACPDTNLACVIRISHSRYESTLHHGLLRHNLGRPFRDRVTSKLFLRICRRVNFVLSLLGIVNFQREETGYDRQFT